MITLVISFKHKILCHRPAQCIKGAMVILNQIAKKQVMISEYQSLRALINEQIMIIQERLNLLSFVFSSAESNCIKATHDQNEYAYTYSSRDQSNGIC
jgi:hypothetical protein